MENKNNTEHEGKSFISLIGGAIALISFFAPWVGCQGQTVSGYDLGDERWLVFVAAGVIVGSCLFFLNAKSLEKAKNYVIISSIIGLGYMVILYIQMQEHEYAKYLEVKWGGVTTALGFLMALIGVSYLQSPKTSKIISSHNNENSFCENCGHSYKEANAGEFCEECGNKL
jgi:drug/metabolite transporter (DMT)-like permease